MIKKRPANARETAAFALFAVAEDGAWSEGALHHFQQAAGLNGRDAALAARLTYGTLQNRSMCDFYLSKYSKIRLGKIAPRVLDALRMGCLLYTSHSVRVAYGGMLTGISVVFLLLASLMPALGWGLCIGAGMVPAIPLARRQVRMGLLIYVATSLLSAMFVPGKRYVVAYALLFGLCV